MLQRAGWCACFTVATFIGCSSGSGSGVPSSRVGGGAGDMAGGSSGDPSRASADNAATLPDSPPSTKPDAGTLAADAAATNASEAGTPPPVVAGDSPITAAQSLLLERIWWSNPDASAGPNWMLFVGPMEAGDPADKLASTTWASLNDTSGCSMKAADGSFVATMKTLALNVGPPVDVVTPSSGGSCASIPDPLAGAWEYVIDDISPSEKTMTLTRGAEHVLLYWYESAPIGGF